MTAAERPPGTAPKWASDAAWSSPGDPWDTNPTKTAPSAGIISQGWMPNEQPPPDRMNWLHSQQGLFGAYQDTLEVQNFDEGIAMGNSVASTEAICAVELDWVNANPSGSKWTGGRRIFVANGNVIYGSARGTKWVGESLAGTPPTFVCIAAARLGAIFSNNVIAGGDTNVLELWTESTRTWSTVTSPGTAHSDAIWQPQLARFLIANTQGGTVPHILALHNDGTTPTDITLTLPVGYSGHANDLSQMIATSPTTTATAIGNTDGTVHVAFFYTPNAAIGTPWVLSQPTLTTNSAGFAFFYDASRALFYFVTQDGHIYSTPDVITFTDLGYTIPYTTTGGNPGSRGSIAVRGPIWTMCTNRGQLVFSVDAGQTWVQVPAPFAGDADDFQQFPMAYVFALVDRFACIAKASSNGTPHQISFSRRLR